MQTDVLAYFSVLTHLREEREHLRVLWGGAQYGRHDAHRALRWHAQPRLLLGTVVGEVPRDHVIHGVTAVVTFDELLLVDLALV